jgi:hypothetical protein
MENKNISLDASKEEFNDFKNTLKVNDKKGAYRLVEIQELAFRFTKELLEVGKTPKGTPLTDQEKEYTEIALKQLEQNYEKLKEEYEYLQD